MEASVECSINNLLEICHLGQPYRQIRPLMLENSAKLFIFTYNLNVFKILAFYKIMVLANKLGEGMIRIRQMKHVRVKERSGLQLLSRQTLIAGP